MKIRTRTDFMRSVNLLLVLILFSAALPAQAIEDGVPDNTRHAVGLLGFDVDGPDGATPPWSLCSGFVISDSAFVTAAHCVVFVASSTVSWAVTLEPGSPRDPGTSGIFDISVYNFWDFPITFETATAIDFYVHPNFSMATMANDVAVILFPPGTFTVTPVRLAPVGFLDRLEAIGVLYQTPVWLVGYGGVEKLSATEVLIVGYRTRGVAVATDLTDQTIVLGEKGVMNNSTLAGDSGAPQFILGRVATLTSASRKQRLDIPTVAEFLAPFVGATE